VLSGEVVKGGYEYELGQGLTTATQNNWYLRSKVFTGGNPPTTAQIPTLSEMALALLALLLAGGAALWMRRNPARR
jgi:type V secretory pathway adhesin AidA